MVTARPVDSARWLEASERTLYSCPCVRRRVRVETAFGVRSCLQQAARSIFTVYPSVYPLSFPKKNGLALFSANPLILLAEWTGLEPATPGVTGRYSNQLNYHSMRLPWRYSRCASATNLASPRGFEPL